jgi:hypothetical protein
MTGFTIYEKKLRVGKYEIFTKNLLMITSCRKIENNYYMICFLTQISILNFPCGTSDLKKWAMIMQGSKLVLGKLDRSGIDPPQDTPDDICAQVLLDQC